MTVAETDRTYLIAAKVQIYTNVVSRGRTYRVWPRETNTNRTYQSLGTLEQLLPSHAPVYKYNFRSQIPISAAVWERGCRLFTQWVCHACWFKWCNGWENDRRWVRSLPLQCTIVPWSSWLVSYRTSGLGRRLVVGSNREHEKYPFMDRWSA